jgi:hypothetical protein
MKDLLHQFNVVATAIGYASIAATVLLVAAAHISSVREKRWRRRHGRPPGDGVARVAQVRRVRRRRPPPGLELMADPRYRAIIDAREFPDATPPVKVSVSVWGLGALHVFTGLGSHFSLDGIKAEQMQEIGNAFCEAARMMHTDEVTPMTLAEIVERAA